jgi:sugar lactone lactonase YvrE
MAILIGSLTLLLGFSQANGSPSPSCDGGPVTNVRVEIGGAWYERPDSGIDGLPVADVAGPFNLVADVDPSVAGLDLHYSVGEQAEGIVNLTIVGTTAVGTIPHLGPQEFGTYELNFHLRAYDDAGSLIWVDEITEPCEEGAIGDPYVFDVSTDGLGLVRNGKWLLHRDNYTFFYGQAGDVPLFGDWDGDGLDTPGMFRPANGFVYLTNTLPPRDGVGVGDPDLTFFFGMKGDQVVVGDWNGDGIDTLGIRRGGKMFLTNLNQTSVAEHEFFFGVPGDQAVGGDPDGDGIDNVFLYRQTSGFVYFTEVIPANGTVAPTKDSLFFGVPSDEIVVGDWNADGRDTVGIFRPGDARFYLADSLSNPSIEGDAVLADTSIGFGQAGWLPVAGIAATTPMERPGHVFVASGGQAEFVHREFLQLPFGAAWGPDGHLYIADMNGRHVVRLAPDGTMEDLGLWMNPPMFVGDGPKDVAFDPDGVLWVSTHGELYRVRADGQPEQISLPFGPSGGITFSPGGDMYAGDRGSGKVYRVRNGQAEAIASGLDNVEDVVFGKDGMLYTTQLNSDIVMRLNPDTGQLSEFYDQADLGGWDLRYLAVDNEGDIWVRGKGNLHQVSPTGEVKPFTVDGVTAPHYQFFGTPETLAGGFGIDEEGGLWLTSFTGRVVHLAPERSGSDPDSFTRELVATGYGVSGVAVTPDGTVYVYDWIKGRLTRTDPLGITATIGSFDGPGGFVYLASDATSGLVYMAAAGQVMTLDSEGAVTHIADLPTSSITVAADGTLYAVELTPSDTAKAIVRLAGGVVEVLTTELGGVSLEGQRPMIGASPDGIYAFSQTTGLLYLVDWDGRSVVVADAATASDEIPYAMLVSAQGEPYLFGYGIYRVEKDGRLTRIAGGTLGDPSSAAFNHDGSLLYVGELGSTVAIPVS